MIKTRLIPTLLIALSLAGPAMALLPGTTFTSTGGTNSFDAGNAIPYPLSINVTGLSGNITDFSVTLSGVTATSFGGDLAALLVGPGGQSTLLLGGNSDGNGHSAVDWTFSPTATTPINLDGSSPTGTYLPNQADNSLSFSGSPASTPYGTLAGFIGTVANGTWNLYLRDQVGDGEQQLAGWSLTILAGPPPEQTSAETTGLPMANVEGQMLINAGSTVTNDVNNHLFNLRAGDGEEDANDSIAALMDEGVVVGQGDGNPDAKSPMAQKVLRSRQWEVFTTVNYGNVKLNAINNQAGVQIDAWAPSVGIERHLSRGLAVGFAVTFLTSDQNYTAGLGRVHLEGPALSAYVSFARKNFWSSLLYSFGSYELDSTRNPGFGFAQAMGTTQTYTNSVQYNTGWNFRFQNNTLVTGPFAGVDYLHGTVNAYSETGGGLAALTFGRQTYQSLVARVGWSVSKKMQTSWAAITPQVRLSYERQNLTNNGTSVSLINAPFTAAGGNQSPGQSYMVAGAGVNFQFNDQLSLLLSYQGQFLRNDMQAHFGSVRLGYKF